MHRPSYCVYVSIHLSFCHKKNQRHRQRGWELKPIGWWWFGREEEKQAQCLQKLIWETISWSTWLTWLAIQCNRTGHCFLPYIRLKTGLGMQVPKWWSNDNHDKYSTKLIGNSRICGFKSNWWPKQYISCLLLEILGWPNRIKLIGAKLAMQRNQRKGYEAYCF